MAEFDLDRESLDRAATLSSRLLQDLRIVSEGPPSERRRELFSDRRYADQAQGVPIHDVLTNVSQMAIEFAMARRDDNKILGVELGEGELAPISMTESLGGPFSDSEDWLEMWDRIGPFPISRFRRYALRSRKLEDRVIVTDVGEAEKGVERSLRSFLSYRFAGIKKWFEWTRAPLDTERANSDPLPPAVGPGGGLQIQVSCLTPGLRLHVSPAYFISWVFFGSPTTPVSSFVLPGRYVFAGDGPMLPKRTKDHGVFSIPPTYHPALTRF